MYVKPGPNTFEPEILGHALRVRDPGTGRVMPPEGAEVPATSHWLRLLRDGDVVMAVAPGAEARAVEMTAGEPEKQ